MRHDNPPTERRQGTPQRPPQPATSSHTSKDGYTTRTRLGSSEDVSRWHTQHSQQSLERPTSAPHVRSEAPARYTGRYAPAPSRPGVVEYGSPSRGSAMSYAPAHPQMPTDHRRHQYAMQYGDLRRSREGQAYSAAGHERGAGQPPLMAPTVLNAPYPQPPPQPPPPPYVVHYPLPQPHHPSQNQLQPMLPSAARGQLHSQEHPYQSEYMPSQPPALFVPMSPAPSSYYQHENPQNGQGQNPYAPQEYGYHGQQRRDADNQQNSSRIGMRVHSNYPPNPGMHTAEAQYQVAPRSYHTRVETPVAPQHPEGAHSHHENGVGIRMVGQLAHDPRYVTAVPGDPGHVRQMASGTGPHVLPPSPNPGLHAHGVMPSHNQPIGQMRLTPHLSTTPHHPGAMPATHLAPIVSSFPLPQGHHQIGYQTNAYHHPTHRYGNPLHYTEVYMQPEVVHQYTVPQPIPKKKRLQWTPELHAKFEAAVQTIGLDAAVPKTLLQAMNVPSLTRENVASHLQKYRDMVKKRKKIEAEEGSQDSKRGQKRSTAESQGTSLRFPEVRRRQRRRGYSGELVDDKEKPLEELREEDSESTIQEEQRVEQENTSHHCTSRSLGDQLGEYQNTAGLAVDRRLEISERPVSEPFTARDHTRAVPRDGKDNSD